MAMEAALVFLLCLPRGTSNASALPPSTLASVPVERKGEQGKSQKSHGTAQLPVPAIFVWNALVKPCGLRSPGY